MNLCNSLGRHGGQVGRLACMHACVGGQAGMWHKGGGSMRGSARNVSGTHILNLSVRVCGHYMM